nr:unnamed protein product [Digitaria exilis]
MATPHVSPASAAVVDAAAAAEKSARSWGLLDGFAWIGNVENATTAVSKTSDNKHIQITFCPPLAPPQLSRFYIHTPDGARMIMEPFIVATEDDIALLRVQTRYDKYPEYYIYQAADDSSGTPPSLTRLPPTPYINFNIKDMGLLRLPGKQYIVAGFRPWPATTGGDWSRRYMIRSFKEVANINPRVNLLPGHTSVCRSFTGLNIRQPVVGLHDDDARILYFVVKTDLTAAKGSVIALDLSTRKILGVSPFVARHKYDFTYMPTGLFKHLSDSPFIHRVVADIS